MDLGFDGACWLVSAPPPAIDGIVCTARREDHGQRHGVVIYRIEATRGLAGLATGDFATPSVVWPALSPGPDMPEGTRAFGYQYTEFALPTHADGDLQRWFLLPFRPSVVMPMWVSAPDGRTLLLGPLDRFHEQVIAVPGARAGWHGDLDTVPVGFATELAAIEATGPRAALDRYAEMLIERHGRITRSRYADALASKPSYWTDNGAAYWYRTEPGLDTPATLAATVDDLRAREVPVDAVQLDSWFYPHETTRPFDTDEWVVPPSGLLRWEPRDDVLPDGIEALRERLGGPPLVTHCRHISSASPYVDEFAMWVDGDRAHPAGVDLYERWLDQAVAWGVETFEHDWLIECFLGVRALRETPGRARAWQEGLDAAARDRGVTLQWCMATPADILQTVTLSQVTSVRTSGDHGYLVGPGVLWAWFLYTNALARALGLQPFKDVFLSGEALAEPEALLSTLSCGPVGIGDRLGAARADVVRRTCRADGVLVKPDVPIAAVDRSFAAHAVARPAPLIGETYSQHAAGRWTYVFTANVYRGEQPLETAVRPDDIGLPAAAGPTPTPTGGEHIVYDWRRGVAEPLGADGWSATLAPHEWDYRVVAPVVGGVALVGDAALFASVGDRRIADVEARGDDEGITVTVLNPGETVELVSWSAATGALARTLVEPAARGWARIDLRP